MTAGKSIAAALAAVVALGAGAASAQARQFEGKVVAKDKGARTFTLKQDEGGGSFKFKVNGATSFQGVGGFGALKRGAGEFEVTARKNGKGGWIATVVERPGRGGDDGGGGGNDDGPNHD